MPLQSGTRLGPYEITAQIGEGGMGEVYRATDTKLKRDVAVKVLPSHVAADPERLARFQREAEVLASLNHPNIAAIYGLEEADSTKALVMELVEGPTLADRIAQGAIPVDEALPIAKQIAEALEAAHEQGIIHRDLKPGNVKLRPDGVVKVLDFGLAKALEPTGAMSPGMSQAPTITTPAMTQAGMILGTAAYMSPEQAKGRTVDKRSDVWAFGAVLYEMLAGQRAFAGGDVSEVLASVLAREPDWTLLPGGMSPVLGTYIRRCLHKDPKQRVHDIADVRLALDGAFETGVSQAAEPVAVVQPAAWRRALPLAIASLVTAVVVGLAAWSLWPSLEPRFVTRFEYVLPDSQTFRDTTGRAVIAISHDGRHVAYTLVAGGLNVRTMGELEARLIPGTNGVLGRPFFSPDGESLGYWDVNTSELKRIAVEGGAPRVICVVGANPFGASWGWDDTVLFGQPQGIMRVSANGGTPELVIPIQQGEQVWSPQLLPDGESVLFNARQAGTPWEQSQAVVQSLRTGERTVLRQGGSDARYVPTGHLVFAQGDALYAMVFDADRLEVRGAPVPLVQGVRREAIDTPTAQYAVSDAGTLVYVPGSGSNPRTLALVERTGTVHPLDLPPGPYVHPRLSPDGGQLTVGTDDGEVWMYDLGTGGGLASPDFRWRQFLPDLDARRPRHHVSVESRRRSRDLPPARRRERRCRTIDQRGGRRRPHHRPRARVVESGWHAVLQLESNGQPRRVDPADRRRPNARSLR